MRPQDKPLDYRTHNFRVLDWIKAKIMGVALTIASFITVLSLIMPAWADFMLDLMMIGLIGLVAKLARKR